ncbi:ABC transporter ATP-binding protein [Oligoflexus tunisiensis]|uniref:ABC transporter ATP-binding protein n=1 Tax=Oligoflexus tunisiensis TaxID=708132 RepID=UPI00114CE15B|nr:ABC transporter ATP-binding protein [Oligoflexus tunisiensis]
MTSLFSCQQISHSYRQGQQLFPALHDVNLEITAGEFCLIMGPSGSGKSTLLNLLGLIEPLQTGKIFFQGQELQAIDEGKKNQLRRFQLGFIFQSFHLFDVLSAAENVEFFLTRQGVPSAERKQRVQESLEAVDLWDHRTKRPQELSGGQRQRVAIARALAKQPAVILADEPTASLDQDTARSILLLLKNLCAQGRTIIISSHDPLARDYASRVLYLKDGRLQAGGQADAH